jgi:hypothetical protein
VYSRASKSNHWRDGHIARARYHRLSKRLLCCFGSSNQVILGSRFVCTCHTFGGLLIANRLETNVFLGGCPSGLKPELFDRAFLDMPPNTQIVSALVSCQQDLHV